MSIVIKDMKMPENCYYDCDLKTKDVWGVSICCFSGEDAVDGKARNPDCPLIDFSSLGRLIDVNILYAKLNQIKDSGETLTWTRAVLAMTEAIIETEEKLNESLN